MKSDTESRRDPPAAPRGDRPAGLLQIGVSISERVVVLAESGAMLAERSVACMPGERTAEHRIEAAAELACSDAELADAVGRVLAWDLWVPDERLTVTVSGGRVTLEGEVNSRFQRDAAVRDVSRLSGVRGITDRMTIRPTPAAAEVRARIARTLGTDAVPGTIRVETFPGAVLLRGSVRSRAERDGAECAAWSVSGVREVCNGLEVRAPAPAVPQTEPRLGSR